MNARSAAISSLLQACALPRAVEPVGEIAWQYLRAAQIARAQQVEHVVGHRALPGERVQPLLNLLQRGLARLELGLDLAHALLSPWRVSPSQRTTLGSSRPWPDQRHDDDAEGDEQDQVAVRKRRAAQGRVGNRQRGGERDHAANAGEGEHERMLPRRRRIAPLERRDQPARQIGRRKHPDEARRDHDAHGDQGGSDADRESRTRGRCPSACALPGPVTRNTRPSIR